MFEPKSGGQMIKTSQKRKQRCQNFLSYQLGLDPLPLTKIPDSAHVKLIYLCFSVNNILFKYKVHRDTTDTSYIQYNTFEKDTEISLRLV